jgi:hypothetical protein
MGSAGWEGAGAFFFAGNFFAANFFAAWTPPLESDKLTDCLLRGIAK